MEQAAGGKAVQGALGNAGDKGLFVLGHDSVDMSYFGGILGISWLLPDFPAAEQPSPRRRSGIRTLEGLRHR